MLIVEIWPWSWGMFLWLSVQLMYWGRQRGGGPFFITNKNGREETENSLAPQTFRRVPDVTCPWCPKVVSSPSPTERSDTPWIPIKQSGNSLPLEMELQLLKTWTIYSLWGSGAWTPGSCWLVKPLEVGTRHLAYHSIAASDLKFQHQASSHKNITCSDFTLHKSFTVIHGKICQKL
jgi:hypothetical protein